MQVCACGWQEPPSNLWSNIPDFCPCAAICAFRYKYAWEGFVYSEMWAVRNYCVCIKPFILQSTQTGYPKTTMTNDLLIYFDASSQDALVDLFSWSPLVVWWSLCIGALFFKFRIGTSSFVFNIFPDVMLCRVIIEWPVKTEWNVNIPKWSHSGDVTWWSQLSDEAFHTPQGQNSHQTDFD